MLEVHTIFRPLAEKEEDHDPFEDPDQDPPDLTSIPPSLGRQFRDVFDSRNARQMPPHRETDHAIVLKPGQEPPYRRTYRLSPSEEQALNAFITNALDKGIIRESTSPAGAPILFVPRRMGPSDSVSITVA